MEQNISEENINILFNRAIQAEKKKDFALALSLYRDILEQNPNFRPGWINIGTLFSRARKYRLAIRSFRKALKMNEDFIVLFNLGVLLYRLNRFNSAIRMFEKALHFEKNYARLHLLLGFALSQQKEKLKAKVSFENALRLEPENHQALIALCFFFINERNYSAAQKYLDRMKELKLEHPVINQISTRLSFYLDHKEPLAIEEKELLELIGSESSFRRYNEFLEEFSQNQEEGRILRMEAEMHIKKREKGIEAIKNSDPDFSRNALDLSIYYLFSGQTRKAAHYLHEAHKNTVKRKEP